MSAQVHQKGRKPKQRKQRTWPWILGFIVGAPSLLIVLFLALAAFEPDRPAPSTTTNSTSSQSGGHQMNPNEIRMVKIAPKDEPMVLDIGGNTASVVTLLEGNVPAGAKTAVVQADLDCAPDQSGSTKDWSHCKNPVKFDDGSTAVFQHHHKLSEVACFTKDQRLSIV